MYNKEYYQKTKKAYQARQRKYRKKPEAYKKWLLTSAKSRAKAKGIPFDLEVQDIDWVEECPVLQVKLEYTIGTHKTKTYGPSLDRINPELGYVKGNIQVISLLANRMKNSASKEELIKFSNWVSNTLK